jgi:hypothetical protein
MQSASEIRQQHSATGVEQRRRMVCQTAYRVDAASQENGRAEALLRAFEESNQGLAAADESQNTSSYLYLGTVIAAYLCDFFLGAAVFAEATRAVFVNNILKILVPAALVWGEVALAIRRYHAQAEDSSEAWKFNIAGAFLAAVMPLLVASVKLAQWVAYRRDSSISASAMILFQVIALTAFCVGLHLFLFFNGRQLFDASVHLKTHFRWHQLQKRVADTGTALRQAQSAAANAFTDYEAARTLYNRVFLPMPSGPFDQTTLRVLRSLFGGAGSDQPDAPPTPPPSGSSGASPPGTPPPPAGERNFDSRNQWTRDADGEVRV